MYVFSGISGITPLMRNGENGLQSSHYLGNEVEVPDTGLSFLFRNPDIFLTEITPRWRHRFPMEKKRSRCLVLIFCKKKNWYNSLHFLIQCLSRTVHDVSTSIFQTCIFSVQFVSSFLKKRSITSKSKFLLKAKLFCTYLVTPVHFQTMFCLSTGRQLVPGIVETFIQTISNLGDEFDFFQKLVFSVVLHQIGVNPSLPSSQTFLLIKKTGVI